jgi:glycosyltransferase involved in cell wall biosynthesis
MTSENVVEISIVMPCLNEAETLEGCIQEAFQAIEAESVSGEVVVADNGSSDGSKEIAERCGARMVEVEERGYGSALMGGIKAAQGKFVLMGDCDGSYDFGELGKFLAELRAGSDLVMGCRLPKGGGTIEPGAMPWLHRWLGNPALSLLGKIFFRTKADDFHCGLRAVNRERMLSLNLVTTGMEFASEMVARASLADFKVTQVPITLRPDKRSRPPHLNTWRDGWRHLKFMLLYSPHWLFLYPGMILFFLGALVFGRLLPGPLMVAGINFDTNTLLVAAALILVGFQVIVFAFFAETYAAKHGLLPPTRSSRVILEGQPFEWGIIAGLLICAGGVINLIYVVRVWQEAGFGDLSYPDSLRMVIPSITAISLGTRMVLVVFLLASLVIKGK